MQKSLKDQHWYLQMGLPGPLDLFNTDLKSIEDRAAKNEDSIRQIRYLRWNNGEISKKWQPLYSKDRPATTMILLPTIGAIYGQMRDYYHYKEHTS